MGILLVAADGAAAYPMPANGKAYSGNPTRQLNRVSAQNLLYSTLQQIQKTTDARRKKFAARIRCHVLA